MGCRRESFVPMLLLALLAAAGSCRFEIEYPGSFLDSAANELPGDAPEGRGDTAGEMPDSTAGCKSDADCKDAPDGIGPCEYWGCNAKTATCAVLKKKNGDKCDLPGNKCVKTAMCVADACKVATEVKCDDSNPCTEDSCQPDKGCQSAPLDGTDCDDGKACTKGDTCKAGKCAAGPVKCDDGNPCTSDKCDADGNCQNVKNVDSPECGDCLPPLFAVPQAPWVPECCLAEAKPAGKSTACDANPAMCGPVPCPVPQEKCGAICNEDMVICLFCPDGVCDPKFESNCNCPEDCPPSSGPCSLDYQCGPNEKCIDGTCIPGCTDEICGDEKDNDCDGKVDELPCNPIECIAPAGYDPVVMSDLVGGSPKVADGAKIAVPGVVKQGGMGSCSADPCPVCESALVLSVGQNSVGLLASAQQPAIGCIEKDCKPEVCTPPKESMANVWGVFVKAYQTIPEETPKPAVEVHGFCTVEKP